MLYATNVDESARRTVRVERVLVDGENKLVMGSDLEIEWCDVTFSDSLGKTIGRIYGLGVDMYDLSRYYRDLINDPTTIVQVVVHN